MIVVDRSKNAPAPRESLTGRWRCALCFEDFEVTQAELDADPHRVRLVAHAEGSRATVTCPYCGGTGR